MKVTLLLPALVLLLPVFSCGRIYVDERDLLYRMAVQTRIENDGDNWADSINHIVPTEFIELVEERYANGTLGSTTVGPSTVVSSTVSPSTVASTTVGPSTAASTTKKAATPAPELNHTARYNSTADPDLTLEDIINFDGDLEEERGAVGYIVSILILVTAISLIGCLAYWCLHSGARNIHYVRSLLDDRV